MSILRDGLVNRNGKFQFIFINRILYLSWANGEKNKHQSYQECRVYAVSWCYWHNRGMCVLLHNDVKDTQYQGYGRDHIHLTTIVCEESSEEATCQ